MPTNDSDQVYDVFISYSHADKEWVWGPLDQRRRNPGPSLAQLGKHLHPAVANRPLDEQIRAAAAYLPTASWGA